MNKKSHICIRISNIDVGIFLHHPEAAAYFRGFLKTDDSEQMSQPKTGDLKDILPKVVREARIPEVCLDERAISIIERDYGPGQFNARTEFETLVIQVSDALMNRRRVILHGVAFIWKDRAWIFAAPSGVGKTTQYRLWKRIWRDEVEIICGDKPVLQFNSENGIMVHPSPWSGKEGYSGTNAAPLAGIIYLERGERNAIRSMSRAEAVVPMLMQWFTFAETVPQINLMCDLEEELLARVPIWKLTNVGDEDSAKLTRHVFKEYISRV